MEDILKVNKVVDPGEHIVRDSGDEGVVVPEDLDNRWLRWKCLVCGYVYEGVTSLSECPKCGNSDPDKFDDAE